MKILEQFRKARVEDLEHRLQRLEELGAEKKVLDQLRTLIWLTGDKLSIEDFQTGRDFLDLEAENCWKTGDDGFVVQTQTGLYCIEDRKTSMICIQVA